MRCEILAALLQEPEILFLDEPTIGLDVLAKEPAGYVVPGQKYLKEAQVGGRGVVLRSRPLRDLCQMGPEIVLVPAA